MILVTSFLILPIIVTLGVDLFTPPSKSKYMVMIFCTIVLFCFLFLAFCAVHQIRGSRVAATEATIELIFSRALNAFKEDVGRYPTTDEGLSALVTLPRTISPEKWMGPYLPKAIPRDPWLHDYVYVSNSGNEFRLYSCGLDGTTKSDGNDADDINSWDDKKTWRQIYDAQAAREKGIEDINRFIVLCLYPALIIFLSYRFYRFRRDNR